MLPLLQNIDRKTLKHQVNKHNEETLRLLLGRLFQQGFDVDILVHECENIYQQLAKLHLQKEG